MDQQGSQGKPLTFWEKVKAAYKSNPLAEKRTGAITCPKCGAKNKDIAISCKECGEKFEYKSAKKGVILGVGLAGSILLIIETWILCVASAVVGADEANDVFNLLWFAAVAGIVATVASYKMKNWGWKLQSIVIGIYALAGIVDGLGSLVGVLILISPLIVSAWLGYKVLQEAGKYLDSLHGKE